MSKTFDTVNLDITKVSWNSLHERENKQAKISGSDGFKSFNLVYDCRNGIDVDEVTATVFSSELSDPISFTFDVICNLDSPR